MKLELENTDDPRNHKFEDLEQIIVLLNNPRLVSSSVNYLGLKAEA